MNQLRTEFVSQLARQLNDTVDYERQATRWLCLLLSPMATLAIVAFIPSAFVTPVFALYCAVYLFFYVHMATESLVITRECINKVLRRRPEMHVALLLTAGEQWSDVDETSVDSSQLHFSH